MKLILLQILGWWLARLEKRQCKAELKWKRGGAAYCAKRMGHYGPHTTNTGIDFRRRRRNE